MWTISQFTIYHNVKIQIGNVSRMCYKINVFFDSKHHRLKTCIYVQFFLKSTKTVKNLNIYTHAHRCIHIHTPTQNKLEKRVNNGCQPNLEDKQVILGKKQRMASTGTQRRTKKKQPGKGPGIWAPACSARQPPEEATGPPNSWSPCIWQLPLPAMQENRWSIWRKSTDKILQLESEQTKLRAEVRHGTEHSKLRLDSLRTCYPNQEYHIVQEKSSTVPALSRWSLVVLLSPHTVTLELRLVETNCLHTQRA